MKKIATLLFCLVFWPLPSAFSNADISVKMPIPGYDPMWKEFEVMWEKHWDGENIDDILSLLHRLENKYSDRIDPYLWLGKCYYLKGLFDLRSRVEDHLIAEKYAVKAYEIDPNNFYAFFILLHALSGREDRSYILSTYGDWIRKMAPLPNEKVLPDLPLSKEWEEVKRLWKDNVNIDKLSMAASIMDTFAEKNPDDALVQMWACVIHYYMGEYYLQMGLHKEKGIPCYEKSFAYSEKALAIEPHDHRANFWYTIALSRKIQLANIFTKAVHLKTLMDHLIFCVRENALYEYCGPLKLLGVMIIEGGWVCEKAMNMAGYSVEMVITFLQIGEMLYPQDYFIHYITAVLLIEEKREKEAISSLERNIRKGPPPKDDPDRLRKMYNYNISKELYERLRGE